MAGKQSLCIASQKSLSILKMKPPQLDNREENTIFEPVTYLNSKPNKRNSSTPLQYLGTDPSK